MQVSREEHRSEFALHPGILNESISSACTQRGKFRFVDNKNHIIPKYLYYVETLHALVTTVWQTIDMGLLYFYRRVVG